MTASKSTATKKTAETIPTQSKDEQDDSGVVVELTGETDNRSVVEKATSFVKENKKTLLAMAGTAATCFLTKVVAARIAEMRSEGDAFENNEETPAA